jgi:hypothetical protein
VDQTEFSGMIEDRDFLTGMLSEVISDEESPRVISCYNELHALATTRAQGGKALTRMVGVVGNMTTVECQAVTRIFTHALNLVNVAEVFHMFRSLGQEQIVADKEGSVPRSEDNMESTIAHINATQGEVYDALCKQKIELVLTAHPTEVNRRTILRKYDWRGEARPEERSEYEGGARPRRKLPVCGGRRRCCSFAAEAGRTPGCRGETPRTPPAAGEVHVLGRTCAHPPNGRRRHLLALFYLTPPYLTPP